MSYSSIWLGGVIFRIIKGRGSVPMPCFTVGIPEVFYLKVVYFPPMSRTKNFYTFLIDAFIAQSFLLFGPTDEGRVLRRWVLDYDAELLPAAREARALRIVSSRSCCCCPRRVRRTCQLIKVADAPDDHISPVAWAEQCHHFLGNEELDRNFVLSSRFGLVAKLTNQEVF